MTASSSDAEGMSASDSEESDDEGVLNRLIAGYASATDESLHVEQRERLFEALQTGRHGCLICLEAVGRAQAVWSCGRCYETYHLPCVQSWSLQAVQLAAANDEAKVSWACPKCRADYSQQERPTRYFCYCGKQENPPNTPWVAAHSCDSVCGRKLVGCEHTCKCQCHPGPCPACPIVVRVSCYCAASQPVARRCGTAAWSCQKVCNKPLQCAQHKCTAKCHPGDCAPCTLTQQRACVCGRQRRTQPCADVSWHCDTVCGKTLACGKHTCQSVCHSGACEPCVRAGQDTCPCGAQSFQGALSCVDQLPCCGGTCGKTLACGQHQCYDACHRGECPKCREQVTRVCRCGAKELRAVCGAAVTCDVKCIRLRQCGRHKCNKKCCEGNCAQCDQVCGRQLNCGRHKCAAPCHRGACYPCAQMATVSCPCGAATLSVPCGLARNTKPPKCQAPCSRPPVCHHPSQTAHKCHAGDCPRCRQKCDQPLQSCGHKCLAVCHSAVPVDVNAAGDSSSKDKGFWDKQKAKYEIRSLPCSPCATLIKVSCLGEHEQSEQKCSELHEYTCGRPCNRLLACANHKCTKICHKALDECEQCHSMCTLPRPADCAHACPRPCHQPPCAPCKIAVKCLCLCGVNELLIQCSKWVGLSAAEQQAERSCGNACPHSMSCGHPCRRQCHDGPCSPSSQCNKKRLVTCACKRKQTKVPCKKADEGGKETLDCDADCLAARVSADSEPREQQEHSANDNDTQEQGTVGKRRNRRKRDNVDETGSKRDWLAFAKQYSIVPCCVAIFSAFVFFLVHLYG